MLIVIRCDMSQDEAQEVCDQLQETLGADVFLGLEDVTGWKIPTEDWQNG